MKSNQQKKTIKPPNLLSGLNSLITLTTLSILIIGWMIINYQIEQLVTNRTSEYAHSITKITADSSAEALLANEIKQLNMLVKNIAKDPYIQSATIFAEDGQVVAQHPAPDTAVTTTASTAKKTTASLTNKKENKKKLAVNKTMSAQTKHYLQSQKDIPFIEKITHDGVTKGWLKISLNRQLLESSFRSAVKGSRNIILIVTLVFLSALSIFIFRYNKRVKNIILCCDNFIHTHAESLPTNKEEWHTTLKTLSSKKKQALPEFTLLPAETLSWSQSKKTTHSIFCYCTFSMQDQDNEQTAEVLSLAEKYLIAAVQTFGVQSQGNILSGCLIPFLEATSSDEAILEAINLTELIKELLVSLPLSISMTAFIGKGAILVLENERSTITGISLSNRLLNKMHQLEAFSQTEDIISLGIDKPYLEEIGSIEEIKHHELKNIQPLFKITSINNSIKQQVSRKVSYIIGQNSD